MLPVRIEGGEPISRPEGWDDKAHGPCGTLHVRRVEQDGLVYRVSAWEAQTMDVAKLLAGANLHLWVSSPKHPVVGMAVDEPPDDFPPVYTVQTIVAEQPTIRVLRVAPSGAVYADAIIGDTGIGNAFARAVQAIEQHAAAQP